jgi:conjugative relaxase-like TrwC/TraI family protein
MSAGGAKDYFEKDSYYTKNQEKGMWQGKVATQMGLVGSVKQQDFETLLQGKDMDGEQQIRLTSKDVDENGERLRAGADFTFSAPKSVSVLYEMAKAYGNEKLANKIIEAHEKSVETSLNRLESDYAGVRRKVDGDTITDKPQGLIIAKFTHDTTRAVTDENGKSKIDPQLHTHSFVMNMTKDQDGNYKSVDYKNMLDQKKLIGQEYRNELASSLKEMGFELQANSKGLFEIQDFDKELLQEMSQRSKIIDEKLAEYKEKFPNKSEPEIRAIIAKSERESKQEIDRDAVRAENIERIEKMGYNKEWLDNKLVSAEQNKANLPTQEQRQDKINETTKTTAKILNYLTKFRF